MKICKDDSLCTGCGTCSLICPHDCINMSENEEGFLYPYVEEDKCIKCNMCKRVCPVNNTRKEAHPIDWFVARNSNKSIVSESTSGGIFSAIAYFCIDKSWTVYGVIYDDNMKVCHIGTKQSDEVGRMRGSKYVQSYAGSCFLEIKNKLDSDEGICFVGTPCQVAGLKAYLGKEYEKLITIDLVCHGVSSPLVFKKYVSYLETRFKRKVIDIKFRNKTYGYHSSTMKAVFEDGNYYVGSGRVDQMSKAYFAGAISRYSCFNCPFKGESREGDITLFDSWNVNVLTKKNIEDDKGFTNIFVNTKKGEKLIGQLNVERHGADLKKMIELDGAMINKFPQMHEARRKLIKEIKDNSFEDVMDKYFKITKKDYLIEKLKKYMYHLGIISSVSKFIK